MQEPFWWWQSSISYSSCSLTSWYLGLHQCLSRDNSALNESNNNQNQPKKHYFPFNQMPMKTPPEATLFIWHAGNHYPVSYLFFRYFQKTPNSDISLLVLYLLIKNFASNFSPLSLSLLGSGDAQTKDQAVKDIFSFQYDEHCEGQKCSHIYLCKLRSDYWLLSLVYYWFV